MSLFHFSYEVLFPSSFSFFVLGQHFGSRSIGIVAAGTCFARCLFGLGTRLALNLALRRSCSGGVRGAS